MDVHIKKEGNELHRTVYRKETVTGLYTRWESFCTKLQKINLIKCLVQRAKKICTPGELLTELDQLRTILRNNGYPDRNVERTFKTVMEKDWTRPEAEKDRTHRAVLKLPYIGSVSERFRKEIVRITSDAYPVIQPTIIFTTRHAFAGISKDVLPVITESLIIYKYQCCCDQQYVGRTTQRFSERIKQHVPTKLRLKGVKANLREDSCDSAVTKHLKKNPTCTPRSDEETSERFRVLAQARNVVHLEILEAVYIRNLTPELCQQKNLKAVHRS